jgi:hypothetical protein
VGVGDVLIDLGEMPQRDRRRAPGPSALGRPFPHRLALGVLALVLVALLAGAVHREPPDPPVVIAARLGDTLFVGDDQVFVVSAGPELIGSVVQNKVISAYALPDGALLSRTTVAVTGAVFNVMAVGRTILVSYQVERGAWSEVTVALAAGTDKALWRHPTRLFAVSEADGLVLLRENTPEAGNVNWFGIDLATGAERWSVRQPPRGFVTEAGSADFPTYLVSATYTGNIEVRDARTGAVLAARTVPVPVGQAGNDLPVWPAGDLILVGGSNGTDAYGLPDLAPRWRSTVALAGRWIQPDCGGLICSLSWRGGLHVIDPRDGTPLWENEGWNFADQIGPYLMASDNTGAQRTRSVSVVEPTTGRVRGVFDEWQVAGTERPDGTVVGIREQLADDVVWYALLDPETIGVKVLGAARGVSGDCQAVPEALVCRRIDASVGIWSLQ